MCVYMHTCMCMYTYTCTCKWCIIMRTAHTHTHTRTHTLTYTHTHTHTRTIHSHKIHSQHTITHLSQNHDSREGIDLHVAAEKSSCHKNTHTHTHTHKRSRTHTHTHTHTAQSHTLHSRTCLKTMIVGNASIFMSLQRVLECEEVQSTLTRRIRASLGCSSWMMPAAWSHTGSNFWHQWHHGV
jgi:hypothetical protein